jgi:hypothetical protein
MQRSMLGLAATLILTANLACADVVVVRDGAIRVSGIYTPKTIPGSPLHAAARDLSEAIEKMSGAKVEVKEVEDVAMIPSGPAIVLGDLAAELGAEPKNASLWKDSMRTVVRGDRILVAGESDMAVSCAVMDLLHEQGVRYFLPSDIPGNIGEIMPAKKTVAWSERDREHHPFIRARRVWGHNMGRSDEGVGRRTTSQWIRRTGGVSPFDISVSHAWGHLVPANVAQAKPELFAIKRYDETGQPVRGGQFCVSNPEVAEIVSKTLVERFRNDPGLLSQSISPNDGGGQCICHNCAALDPPNYLEPTSGKPAISDRYIYFYNQLAERVAKEFPDRFLAFFVYSDYSRAPVKYTKLHPMLFPVFAPIRYSRIHSMFNPLSESNLRLRGEIEVYMQYAKNCGFYGYNYNLAEATMPFSKVSVWSEDLPYLARKGLAYVSLETLGNWNSNAPHFYLGTRYIYSGEDPRAIMDDYYQKLCGAAANEVRAYWEAVDHAYRDADIHSGGYYGIELIMTPEKLGQLQQLLDHAATAAQTDRERAVVALFQTGLDQGQLQVQMINQLNRFQFAEAKGSRDQLRALNTQLETDKIVSIYPNRYLDWFVSHIVDAAAAVVESGATIAVKFPNTWLYRADFYAVGVEEQWFDPSHGDRKWLAVQTWGAPSLVSQGHGDWKGHQWFKATVEVPADGAQNMMMWFGANDGSTRLWINGQPVPFAMRTKTKDKDGHETEEVAQTLEWPKGWRSFAVPVGQYLKPGAQNTFVVRLDHTLADLNLGGFLRPVMLYVPGEKELNEVKDTYQQLDI